MKKSIILGLLTILVFLAVNSFKTPFSATTPQTGYTGAPPNNRYCTNCHNDFALNSGGGSVTVTGLPSGTYNYNQAYDFSVTINHPAGASIWSFEIKACQSDGTVVGTFTTTNPSCVVNNSELKPSDAVAVNGTSYTYNNLRWTAPASGTATVNFYVTGLAGDFDGGNGGDYVYSNSIMSVILPVTFGDFSASLLNNAARLNWKTYSESNFQHFEIERSIDGNNFSAIAVINGQGTSNIGQNYSYTDSRLPSATEYIYYRLKLVDMDGSYRYSKTANIRTNGFSTAIVKTYPTVIRRGDALQVEMTSSNTQSATIAFYDMNGKKIFQKIQQLGKGNNSFTVNDIAPLNAGIFVMKITTTDFTETQKIFVQ